MNFDYYWYTDIGGRSENEDSVGIIRCGENIVAVIADGLGGQGDGKVASEVVRNNLLHCGDDGLFPDKQVLQKAFGSANQNLMRKQKNAFHMKSTAVYLCLQNARAIWAHIGDSRLYHVYEEQLVDYTLDHSASQLAVYLGEIAREEISHDPGRNRLIKAMGVEGDEPEIRENVLMRPGQHAFLLCSDGLWEYLNDEIIVNVLSHSETSKEALNRLREVKEKKCPSDCDNNSGIVIFVKVQV